MLGTRCAGSHVLTEVPGNRSMRCGGRRELAEQLLTRPERDPLVRAIMLHFGRIELEHIASRASEDRPPYACVIHLRQHQKTK